MLDLNFGAIMMVNVAEPGKNFSGPVAVDWITESFIVKCMIWKPADVSLKCETDQHQRLSPFSLIFWALPQFSFTSLLCSAHPLVGFLITTPSIQYCDDLSSQLIKVSVLLALLVVRLSWDGNVRSCRRVRGRWCSSDGTTSRIKLSRRPFIWETPRLGFYKFLRALVGHTALRRTGFSLYPVLTIDVPLMLWSSTYPSVPHTLRPSMLLWTYVT